MTYLSVRPECLLPHALGWMQPTVQEVEAVIEKTGLNKTQIAQMLGLQPRQVRRWTEAGKPIDIPYSAWAILCVEAELGVIWKKYSR